MAKAYLESLYPADKKGTWRIKDKVSGNIAILNGTYAEAMEYALSEAPSTFQSVSIEEITHELISKLTRERAKVQARLEEIDRILINLKV